MNLLIIEDDIILLEKIWRFFNLTWNFNKIKLISSFDSFKREYHMIEIYDIIIVDIILSKDYNDKDNWIKIVNLIRKKTDEIPIIVISWLWDINRLESAFWNWVNDYLIKPIRLRELEIRIERWFKTFLYNKVISKRELKYFDLRKDLLSWEFYYKNIKVNLTKKSKFILTLFLTSPEKLLTEKFLIDKIWWDISSIIDRNPRVNIIRLKKSLESFWIENWIVNVWWEWYMLKKN